MLSNLSKSRESIIISTGNVLNVNDLRKKAGLKPTEELLDCLKSTLIGADVTENPKAKQQLLTRKNNDLSEKIHEHERANIKIGAKIFLNNFTENCLGDAIDKLFETLNVDFIDNLILAYHPRERDNGGVDNGERNGDVKEGVIEWGIGTNNALNNLKNMWSTLESYSAKNKIGQLGIADLDVETLKQLFENSKVHPSIAQINLAACCVVPPQLQEFCSKNEIQLLTHSDPQEIITQSHLSDVDFPSYHPAWITRYQVHIKCRGVLAAKGFIISIEHNN